MSPDCKPPFFREGNFPPRERWRKHPRARRVFFMRLVGVFIGMSLLFSGALTLLMLSIGPFRNSVGRGEFLILAFCAVPLFLVIVTGFMATWTFRRIGSPLAELMAAADAVAEGNLAVQVRETVPGEMGRFAARFNRMVAELARAEQQRRSLTADVAHELRTPLHIIQGNLEGLLDGVYEPSADHITATLEETRLLARLVSDLQTLSLAEAGQLPLHRMQVSAADLLADVSTRFARPAEEQGVELAVEVDESGDLMLWADSDRLDQVLSNLVTNALRYTPAGGRITLGARPSGSASAGPGVCLWVADTGAGIAPEDLPYIFDRFWKGDRARTRGSGGSGLGLAIARQLVQAHGGAIRAASRPGEGTTFTIELPRGEPAHA